MNYCCRTCSKYSIIEEWFSVELKIVENKSVLELIKEWTSIQVLKDDKLPRMICKVCFISIKSFIDFINLIRKSDENFKELYKPDRTNLKATDTSEIKPAYFKESINRKTYSSETSKELHGNTSNNKSSPDELCSTAPKNPDKARKSQLFDCRICPRVFKKLDQYKTHMLIHNGEKNYSCKVCGKGFSKSYVLLYHMRVHTGEKRFSCNYCSKSFIHPSNLYKHRKIHTNTRNYKCEFCSKSFIQSEAMKIHIRRIHTGERPFLCEICSKSFSCQSALLLHKQDTHLEKEACPLCEKEFSSRTLKQHMILHRNKELKIKKSICEQCGKNFSSDHNLKQHLLIHDGIKPYASQPIPCPLCKKSYSKRRIKSHICMVSND